MRSIDSVERGSQAARATCLASVNRCLLPGCENSVMSFGPSSKVYACVGCEFAGESDRERADAFVLSPDGASGCQDGGSSEVVGQRRRPVDRSMSRPREENAKRSRRCSSTRPGCSRASTGVGTLARIAHTPALASVSFSRSAVRWPFQKYPLLRCRYDSRSASHGCDLHDVLKHLVMTFPPRFPSFKVTLD